MKKINLKEINKRWFILLTMVIFDGLASHYPSIFFGAPIREPNPVTGFFLYKFGVGALIFMIPSVILLMWLAVKGGSWYMLKFEKWKDKKKVKNVLLNGIIIVYSILVIIPLILVLTGRLLHFRVQWLPFKWLVIVGAIIAIIYSLYIDLIYKKNVNK